MGRWHVVGVVVPWAGLVECDDAEGDTHEQQGSELKMNAVLICVGDSDGAFYKTRATFVTNSTSL